MPVVCTYYQDHLGRMGFDRAEGEKRTHWWLRGPDAQGVRGRGIIYDLTAAQYPKRFPYEKGRNVGFMQQQCLPSRRARFVMDRVAKRLGAERLAQFRAGMIACRGRAAPQGKAQHRKRAI